MNRNKKKDRNSYRNNQPSVRHKLKEFETKAYKKFGQNFLLDKQYVDFMINGLDIHDKDFIIEVGPGMGALTDDLIATVGTERYLAIEIDLEKIVFLKRKYPEINIINISILDFDVIAYLKENNIEAYKIIGSLPFNISKKIFQKFSEIEIRPKKAVFMVQKEVGEDYSGSSSATFLSIYLSQYWTVDATQIVPAKAFYPVPKVDGMNIVMSPVYGQVDERFLKFVKRGFSAPRKKLGNTLNLEKENIFYNKRPHELTVENWKDLYFELRTKSEI